MAARAVIVGMVVVCMFFAVVGVFAAASVFVLPARAMRKRTATDTVTVNARRRMNEPAVRAVQVFTGVVAKQVRIVRVVAVASVPPVARTKAKDVDAIAIVAQSIVVVTYAVYIAARTTERHTGRHPS